MKSARTVPWPGKTKPADLSAPRGLSERVSHLSTQSELSAFLRDLRQEFNLLPGVEDVMLNGAFQSVPGFAYLHDAKQAKVNEQLSANRYIGVGIALGMDPDTKQVKTTKVFYDGPAWKAGVKKENLKERLGYETLSGGSHKTSDCGFQEGPGSRTRTRIDDHLRFCRQTQGPSPDPEKLGTRGIAGTAANR